MIQVGLFNLHFCYLLTKRSPQTLTARADGLERLTSCEQEVKIDLKEEPSLYKVGASCKACKRDLGVVGRVFRSDVSHEDEVYERADAIVRGLS